MSDLIKRDSTHSLSRGEDIKPKSTFDRNSIYTVTEENKKTQVPKQRKKTVATTTIRCSASVSNRINAIVTSFGLDSVNELLEILLTDYESTLTNDERRELKTLIEVYSRKNKKWLLFLDFSSYN